MKWTFAILISTLVTLFLQFAQAQGSNKIVATVGTKKITLDEFNKKYSDVSKQVVTNMPSKKIFLEDLIRYEIGIQEAKKKNIEKDPIFIDRMNQEIYKILLEKELGQKVQESQVTEAEMKAFYAKNPQIRISDILIEVKNGATAQQKEEAKKRALEILADVLKSKRPFEELARLYSDDLTTKNLGGDIGWQSRITLIPTYYEAALKMKMNQITDSLVETPFGFHIFKLTGRRTYEEATKREIRMAVFDEKRKIIFDQYFNGLKKKYTVDANPEILD